MEYSIIDFTSRQLRAFLLVAQHRSFSRAAGALFITPSGLSLLIRELETQLGVRLFERTTRHVALTAFGTELLTVAQRNLQELDGVMSRIGQSASETAAHDTSSAMAREKWMWDVIVRPKVPSTMVGFAHRKRKYPLRVKKTTFENSKGNLQLQLADALAGTTAEWGKARKSARRQPQSKFLLAEYPFSKVTKLQNLDPSLRLDRPR